MSIEATIEKLKELKLNAMAAVLEAQVGDPAYESLSFEERLDILVECEWLTKRMRKARSVAKGTGIEQVEACVENIKYFDDRRLDKELVSELSTCDFAREHRNVLITGSVGSGKTYIASALGMKAAECGFEVRYIRMAQLALELDSARLNGTLKDVMRKYLTVELLILDEWLLTPLDEDNTRIVYEIIAGRSGKASTIVCSCFEPVDWPGHMGDTAVAGVVYEKLCKDAYALPIACEGSMRERRRLYMSPRFKV